MFLEICDVLVCFLLSSIKRVIFLRTISISLERKLKKYTLTKIAIETKAINQDGEPMYCVSLAKKGDGARVAKEVKVKQSFCKLTITDVYMYMYM